MYGVISKHEDDLKDALHIAQTDRDKWKARAQKLAKLIHIKDCDIDLLQEDNIETRNFYMIGYEECLWGGYETLDEAKTQALKTKTDHPDKEITIRKEIDIMEIIEQIK